MLHADLGRMEWRSTTGKVEEIAGAIGQDLEIVRGAHDLLHRFRSRWTNCIARYASAEAIRLPSPWSSSNGLFCKSEQKETVLSLRKGRIETDLPVVGIVGIRHEESPRRAKASSVSIDTGMARRARREGILWNPILHWTRDQVFAYHHEHGLPLHEAYGMGSTRLSCAYCVLGSINDHKVARSHPGNRETYLELVDIEVMSGFSFQNGRWLADLDEDNGISPETLQRAKEMAVKRRDIESGIPPEVLKRKSVEGIQRKDAETLSDIRRRISRLYGIAIAAATADDIMDMSQRQIPKG